MTELDRFRQFLARSPEVLAEAREIVSSEHEDVFDRIAALAWSHGFSVPVDALEIEAARGVTAAMLAAPSAPPAVPGAGVELRAPPPPGAKGDAQGGLIATLVAWLWAFLREER
jgi:hypothetical protein